MFKSEWSDPMMLLNPAVLQPLQIDNLKLTLIDAVPAYHEAGWVSAGHRHPWFEFNYVSRGVFFTSLEKAEFSTGEGQFFLIPPGCFHSHRSLTEATDDGFCLRFTLESAGSFDRELLINGMPCHMIESLSTVRCHAFRNDLVTHLINQLNAGGEIRFMLALFALLFDLCRLWQTESVAAPLGRSNEAILADQVILYLNEYYKNRIHMSELSDSLNVSYRHLARIFKQATGVTIVEKLNDIRINQAKKLLMETNKTLHEIAEAAGFENEYYFSKIFNKLTFSTPSAFRGKFCRPKP